MIVPTVAVAVEEEEVVVVKGGLRYSALGVTQKGKTLEKLQNIAFKLWNLRENKTKL